MTLEEGITKTYNWIMGQIAKELTAHTNLSDADISDKKYLAYGNCGK